MRRLALVLATVFSVGAALASAVTEAVLSSVRLQAPQAVAKQARLMMAAPVDAGCEVTLAFTGEEDLVFPIAVARGTLFEFDFVGDAEMEPLYYLVQEASPEKETRFTPPANGHYAVTIESKTRIEVVCRRPIYVDRDPANLSASNASTGYYPNNALESIQSAVALALDGAEIRVRGGFAYAPFCVTNRQLRLVSDLATPAVIDGAGKGRCVEIVEAVSNVTTAVFEYFPATNGLTTVRGFTLTHGATLADGGAAWGGTYVACRLTDSQAKGRGGALFGAEARNCLITGCSAQESGSAVFGSTLKNCTVAANAANGGGAVAETACYNSIVFDNGKGTQIGAGCENIATFTFGIVFGDAYHLRANSAGINGGLQDFVDDIYDLDGKPRRDGVKVSAGCFQTAQASTDTVGVTVNGQDLSFGGGDGWAYDPATSNLTISAAGLYTLSGAATGVSVTVAADAGVFCDDLKLDGAPGAVFTVVDGKTLTFAGGTADLVGTADVSGKVVIAGGAICLNGKTFTAAVNLFGARVYGVELEGFAGAIRLRGLDGYADRGLKAIDGRLYLWLPKGLSQFVVVDDLHPEGVNVQCYVDETLCLGEAYAKPVATVGQTVDGVDVSALAGEGWVYFPNSGSLLLLAAQDYVLSGTSTRMGRLLVLADAHVTFDRFRLGSNSGPVLTVFDSAKLVVKGGTARLKGASSARGRVVIAGGNLDFSPGLDLVPTNPAGQPLHRVDVNVASLGSSQIWVNEGLHGYGTDGLYPMDGRVYLWLPSGEGIFTLSDDPAKAKVCCRYTVSAGATTASAAGANIIETGVTINGQEVGRRMGDGWLYDTSSQLVEVTEPGNYILSGTNMAGEVMFAINADATVTLSNICLRCTTADMACLWATKNVKATLLLAGTNTLEARGAKDTTRVGDGLRLENGARLVVKAAPGFPEEEAVLIVNGSYDHAAIAVGQNGTGESRPYFEIAGGTVYANWIDEPAGFSVGIGSSYQTNKNGVGDIVISGGRVFARGGVDDPGIGSSEYAKTGAPDIFISGGSVEAIGGEKAAGIGGGCGSTFGNVTISGGTVRVTGGTNALDVLAGNEFVSGGVFKITGGSFLPTRLGTVALDPAPVNAAGQSVWCVTVSDLAPNERVTIPELGDYGEKDLVADDEGKVYLWLPNGLYAFVLGEARYSFRVADAATVAEPVPSERYVSYLDWTASGFVQREIWARVLTPDTTVLSDGNWYVVKDDVETTNLQVQGTAHLILADGATLRARATGGYPGIGVNRACELTIYGQVEGTGRLIAQGNAGGAGIGSIDSNQVTVGDNNGCCGTVTINGGVIVASGSQLGSGAGAAIGGSNARRWDAWGHGGTITINGGRIKATGCGAAACIGGSSYGNGATFLVRGGTVETLPQEGFSIGNGKYLNDPSAGVLKVLGGSIVPGEFASQPTNEVGQALRCVTVDGLPEGRVTVTGLAGYGVHDVYPIDGKVYFWLPDGAYTFCIGGNYYRARVAGAATAAEPCIPKGVLVNGQSVLMQTNGPGWHYDRKTKYVEITEPGDYVLSGTNTAGEVMFAIDADARVTLSNLCLKCTTLNECCLWATNNTTVTLYLAGTNTLDASGETIDSAMGEGLCIENGTRLTVTCAPGFSDNDAVLIAHGSANRAAIAVGRNGAKGLRPYFEIAGGTVYANWVDAPARWSCGIGCSYATFGAKGDADIRISGGLVYAKGGTSDPGIGSADVVGSTTLDITITGGRVEAIGGMYAAGIGTGNGSKIGNVTISGGTVRVTGGTDASDLALGAGSSSLSGKVRIDGGSVVLTRLGTVAPKPSPVNSVGEPLTCVFVSDLTPLAPVTVTGLEDYGTTDLFADGEGQIALWLPRGVHGFEVDGVGHHLNVGSQPQTALRGSLTGVTVNGTDAAFKSGTGWTYDPETKTLSLAGAGPFVLSGTNTTGEVSVSVEASAALTLDNLSLATEQKSCLRVANGVAAALTLKGAITLAASGEEGLHLGYDAKATVSCDPTGGVLAAEIGGSSGARITVNSGTVARMGAGVALAVTGGSVRADAAVVATNAAGVPLRCVTVEGLESPVSFENLGDYGTDGIVPDADGKVYLWLPDGDWIFRANGRYYRAVVDGDAVTAQPYDATAAGLTVNGVSVLYGPRKGWSFDTYRRQLVLDGSLDGYVLAGTNDEIEIVAKGTFGLTLRSAAVGALFVAANADVRLFFDGLGCDIGAGLRFAGDAGTLEITDGTAAIAGVTGGTGSPLRISGGSIEFLSTPENIVLTDTSARVLLPTVIELPEACPANVPVNVEGLGAYGVSQLYPRNGRLYLWLPERVGLSESTYITVNGWYYRVDASRDPAAEIAGVTTGFTVNGRDVGAAEGPGWAYDIHLGELTFADASVTNVLFSTNNAADYALVPTAADGIAATICGTLDWSAPGRRFDGAFVIAGGNILASSDQFAVQPTNGSVPVYAVRLTLPEDVKPGALVHPEGLAGYSARQMYAIGREVCFWLPDGEHLFTVNGARCRAVVAGADTRATYCETGVFVDGVDCVEMKGPGWTWSPVSKKLTLAGAHRFDTVPLAEQADAISLVCGDGAEIIGGTSDLPADRVVGGLKITGGSHRFDGTFAVPPSNGTARVYRVDITVPYGLSEGDEVPIVFAGYAGTGIRVRDGFISLWLPETPLGFITIDGVLYTLRIGATGTSAQPLKVGIRVNGDDIGCGRRAGWTWDYTSLKLLLTGDVGSYAYTVDGESHLALTEIADSTTVLFSNTVIRAEVGSAAFSAAEGIVTTFRFKGAENAIVGESDESGWRSGVALGGEGRYVLSGGTVSIAGTVTAPLEINGGSVCLSASASLAQQPVNAAGEKVYCVTVPVPRLADRARALTVVGLPEGYDVEEIYPLDGKLYFWLPIGDYQVKIGTFGYDISVAADGKTSAELDRKLMGVFINGVDCSYANDTGWTWSPVNNRLYLSGACEYVISGVDESGSVAIVVTNTSVATKVVLDDLHLSGFAGGQSAIDIRPGAELVLGILRDNDDDGPVLAGAPGAYNAGDNSGRGGAGIHVPIGAKLTVGGAFEAETDPYGVLTVTGGRLAAGIGGVAGETMGEVTICDHRVFAYGGDRAAGVGGGSGGAGGVFALLGGELNAIGGDGVGGSEQRDDLGGAGLGGGWNGNGGAVTIRGGILSALGGAGGAVIGGGAGGNGGTVQIFGGTVYPYAAESAVEGASVFGGGSGGADGVNVFCGGSIAITDGAIRAEPSNGVARVTLVPIELPREAEGNTSYVSMFVRARIDGLPADYGTTDIFSYEGHVYLWLPDGAYDFTIDDVAYSVTVDEGVVTERHYRKTGVSVNGRDICFAEGPGWTWNPATAELALSGDADFLVTGEAERSNVWVNASGEARVVLSNFIAAASIDVPLQAASGQPSFRFAGASDRFRQIGGEGTAVIAGGNVVFDAIPANAQVVVKGGNVVVLGAFPTNQVKNAEGRPLVPVTLPLDTLCAEDSRVSVTGLPADYDCAGIRARDGRVCLWLPYGTYAVDLTGYVTTGEARTYSITLEVYDFGFRTRFIEQVVVQDDGEDIVIPRSWVRRYGLVADAASTADYTNAVLSASANGGIPVWQSFVAGLDPTNPEDLFLSVIETTEDGSMAVGPNVMRPNRVYTVLAAKDLSMENARSYAVGIGGCVVFPVGSDYKFFKVKVGLE